MVGLPGAFGFAIIGLTVFVRLLLHPFFKQQVETAKKMQEIKPHLDKLSKKHKKNPQMLQQEQLKLYQQAGINPAAGCLFMIIQMPIFLALYNTLSKFLVNGTGAKIIAEINKVLYSPALKIDTINPWFFGFNLALSPAKAGVWFYYLIPVVTAVLQYLQVSLSTPKSDEPEKKSSSVPNESGLRKDKKEGGEDFQKAMGTQMKFIFPLMIGWFSYSLPVGLSLYWNIFSVFSIIQYKSSHAKKK
jgi:YidC/Oxa1 family membrane protein insertase